MSSKFVVYGKEMTKNEFATFLGDNQNKAIVRLLINKGWDTNDIVDFTGFPVNFVEKYTEIYTDYKEKHGKKD